MHNHKKVEESISRFNEKVADQIPNQSDQDNFRKKVFSAIEMDFVEDEKSMGNPLDS
jgi:hypothetical protein